MQLEADPNVTELDRMLGRRVLEVLYEHYPGWSWSADVPSGQNAVIVRNLDCDPRGRYGIFFRKDRLDAGDMSLKVMMAGGEFLERFQMIRRGYEAAHDLGQFEGRNMVFEKPDA